MVKFPPNDHQPEQSLMSTFPFAIECHKYTEELFRFSACGIGNPTLLRASHCPSLAVRPSTSFVSSFVHAPPPFQILAGP
eukprot:scaffold23506_cov93-Cylindrotheca_fusiformis.AAC.3